MASGACALPSPAAALDRILVLPSVIRAEGAQGPVGVEALHDQVVRLLELAPGLEPIARSEVDTALAAAIAGCGTEVGCISARLRDADITFALEVIVNLRLDPALLTMQLVDSRSRSLLGTEMQELGGGDLSGVMAGQVERTLALVSVGLGGKVQVELQPPDAQLEARPDQGIRWRGTTLVAPAGVYRLHARRDGYQDAEREVVIAAREESRVRLALEERSLLSSPLFWIVLGGAVIGAGVAAAVLLQPGELRLCQGRSAADCQ